LQLNGLYEAKGEPDIDGETSET